METSLRLSSGNAIQRTESGGSLDGSNALGIRQGEGTSSRLSSAGDDSFRLDGDRSIKPLAYDGGDLRRDVGNRKSLGRFKNWLADKLPFVGRTTYGRILQRTDTFSASAASAKPGQKIQALDQLRNEIASWQARHPNASGAKADGLAKLDQALASARREAAMAAALERRYPAALTRPADIAATLEADGPLPENAQSAFEALMAGDPREKANGGLRNETEIGKPTVSFSFKEDYVGRANLLSLSDDSAVIFDRKNDRGEDARDALARFTGDATVALNLSHYIGQNMMGPLQGAKIHFLQPADGGEINQLLGTPTSYANDVRKTRPGGAGSEAVYTITYTMLDQISMVGTGTNPDAHVRFTDSELAMTYQIQLKESDLRAGNGVFTYSQEPRFAISLTPDMTHLAALVDAG